MSAAVAFFYLGYAENRKYYYLCYVAAAFATLTKGPIGILLPGLGCVLFLLYKKDIREMLHVHLISGLILFALIGAPWYGIMWHIHGNDFILNFLGVHNFLRGCDKMVNHFVAASFLRLYFIIFSSAVSLLRKNARKPPYPHKTFNYIVLGGNPYTHYFCDVFP